MKKTRYFRNFILAASITTIIAAPSLHAAIITWDANGAVAGQTDGTGPWLSAGQWWDGVANVNWSSGDDAVFGNGGLGGAVALASGTTLNSLTINSFTGTYTLGTAGQTIILNNGITKNASGIGTVTFASSIVLGAAQTWTNHSTGTINSVGTVTLDNGGFDLTIAGSGSINFGAGAANLITMSGAGGIIKNGTGLFALGAGGGPAHTFTGAITINGGGILTSLNGTGFGTGNGNVTINDGYIELYFANTFGRTLGAGAGNIQILGGTSGFSGQGANASTVTIGAALSTLTWGSAFFNPNIFLLGSATANANGKLTFANGLDLNGADRTITSLQNTDGAANSGATITGVISNSGGTPAGLTKTGPGNLILSGTNTYNGATTISGGWITANSTAALGNSSATNTLIFNGGTLRAGGALTSAATRSVTASSTATIDTNGFAVSIAGAMTGGGGLTKNGAGTLTLSGANNYSGITTVNGGTLLFANQSALYNGAAGSWTASNINVKGGGVFGVNVDSAGASGFSVANLDTLLTNIFVANSAATGLQANATLGLDTNTATSGTFTPNSAIANSTGVFGGMIGLTKLGAGSLVLDQSNTYTGATIIGGGTLQLGGGGTGGSLSASNIITIGTGATFAVNQSDTVTQGVDFSNAILTGAGGLTQAGAGTTVLNLANFYTGPTTVSAGTLSLANANAIQNSALVTTGTGSVTLGGGATLTLGGLSGATGDLASVISSGYSSVTALRLNPITGSVTYGGAIADGAAGMALTKTGGGTQILQGASTYTGATSLNAGTVELSGAGSLLTTSGITLSGGALTLTNSAAEVAPGRLADGTGITANGGSITYNNTAGANVYAETIGSVALTTGQLNIVLAVNQNSTGSQTLTLSGLTHAGASNPSAITFSANTTAPNATKNIITITGAAQTPAGQIIGPWATTGTATTTQSDYAIYNPSAQIVPAALANTAESGWSTAANAYSLNTGSAVTLTGTRTITALQFFGATSTLSTASGFNLETNGLLFSGSNAKTVASTGTGVLTTPTGGGNLFITSGVSTVIHTVSAVISDNGGAVTVVKSGAGGLVLSGTNTFTGGVIINGGQLEATLAPANLGSGSADIVFNGSGRLRLPASTQTYSRGITINNGAIAELGGNGTYTFTGNITGTGGIAASAFNFGSNLFLNGPASAFEGPILIGLGGGGGNSYGVTLASLADTATANGRIVFGGATTHANGSLFAYTGSTNLTLANRQLEFTATANPANGHQIRSSGTGIITINTDLAVTSAAAQNLSLGGTNTGANTFNGKITNGASTAIGIIKANNGNWALSNTNTYTGPTTMGFNNPAGGSLVFQGIQALSPSTTLTQNHVGGVGGHGTFKILDDAATPASRTGVNLALNSSNTSNTMTLFVGNNGGGNGGNGTGGTTGSTITLGNLNANQSAVSNTNQALAITGANGYRLRIGNVTANLLAASGAYTIILNPSSAPLTVAGNVQQAGNGSAGTLTLQLDGGAAGNKILGNLINSADATPKVLSLTKSNTGGDWTLSGINNFTGNTTINGGVLEIGDAGQFGSGSYGGNIAIAAASGGTFRINSTADQILSGIISGAGALFKNNLGTLTLTGANPYTGATTVLGGTLFVNGSISGSAVTVNGGTLGGTGSITGAVTVNTGGTLAAGNSIQSLATGALTMNGSSTFAYELNNDAAPGFAGDLTAITGNLTLDLANTTNITFTELGTGSWAIGEKLTLASYSGTWNGGLFNYGSTIADDSTISFSGFDWTFNYNDTVAGTNFTGDLSGSRYVTLTALVPEPGTAMSLLAGLGTLAMVRRRRA